MLWDLQESHCRPIGPHAHRSELPRLCPHPESPWVLSWSDHSLAWTWPWAGASWTPLLLHPPCLFSVSLWVGLRRWRHWPEERLLGRGELCLGLGPRAGSPALALQSAHPTIRGDLDTEVPCFVSRLSMLSFHLQSEKRSCRLKVLNCVSVKPLEDVLSYIWLHF